MSTRADVQALRRVEAVAVHEQHAEAGQRLAAPAAQRAGRMWATLHVHVDTNARALVREHLLDGVLGLPWG